MNKNPEHKGKIPWAMASRQFGEEAARQLVEQGKVAPNPVDEKYGDALPYLQKLRIYAQQVTEEMNEAGQSGHFRVSLFGADDPEPAEAE